MTPYQRERSVSIAASAVLHLTLMVGIWMALTEWDHESQADPVQFVELVSMPKLEELEPEKPAAISTQNHQAENAEKIDSANSAAAKPKSAAANNEKQNKLPDPSVPPKSTHKPAASKGLEKLPDKKSTLKQKVKQETEEVPDERPLTQIPLNLTPSLEAVTRWDRNRRIQAITQTNGSADEVVDINTKSSQFGDYFARVKQRITWSWVYPQQAKNEGLSGNVDLIFTINREGKVVEVKVTRSSGVPILDQEAVAAVRKAAPFGPLPEDWQPARMIIRSTFEYVLTNAGMKFVR